MDDQEIDHLEIYPPIGIARIGNSKQYFLASDLPGQAPSPKGGFKDKEGKIKKQAALFRIYAFDKKGNVIREITENDADIEWRVHVANIKSAWYEFNNALDLDGYAIPSEYRNKDVDDRSQLVINPGSRTIAGRNQKGKSKYRFDTGTFFQHNVPLGEIQTDKDGRLIFIGGDGTSVSKDNLPPTTFANNEGWHDDTSDGAVRATVQINGKKIEAKPAMVAVTPPNFAPGIFGVITMYDVVLDLFINEFSYPDPTVKKGINFWEHIYPVFQRMTDTQWVNHGFFMLFGQNSPADFSQNEFLDVLSDNSSKAKKERMRVFNWFRDPTVKRPTPNKVPPFYGDGFGEYTHIALDDLPLTPTLYKWLKKWAEGDFYAKKTKKETSFQKLSLKEQIKALNRAPLEECLGGPFHPGIELTWPMRVKRMWEKPFRLNTLHENELPNLNYGSLLSPAIALGKNGPLAASGPGSLTRWLGVPWQTDEASCLSGYDTTTYLSLPSFWAARVPNQVLSKDSYERLKLTDLPIGQRLKHFDYRQDWLRELGTQYLSKINKMVSQWHDLGVITENEAVTDTELLPKKIWSEDTGITYEREDPSFIQVKYAENIEDDMPRLKSASKSTGKIKPRPVYKRDER